MRLDKFLQNSSLIQRRKVAKEACHQGRVEVHGKVSKPGVELKEGDVIKITFGTSELEVRVEKLLDTVKKVDAESMYTVI